MLNLKRGSAGFRICPFCGWELKLLGSFSPLDESQPRGFAFCSCPLQEHSSELSRKKIPKRLYRLFDRIGTNIANYRPGACWCKKCATIADTVFSQEPDYNPPPKVRMFYLVYIIFQFKIIHTNKHPLRALKKAKNTNYQ